MDLWFHEKILKAVVKYHLFSYSRFLACVKNGMEVTEYEKNLYADSWNKSAESTVKLFDYFRVRTVIIVHLDYHSTCDGIVLRISSRERMWVTHCVIFFFV